MRGLIKRISALLPILVLCVVLQVMAEDVQGRAFYSREDLPKRISVVKTDTPPVIDGIISPGEWDGAAMITGLTRVATVYQSGVHGCGCVIDIPERGTIYNMAGHQSFFWITYDSDYLYVAHFSPPPPYIKDSPATIEVMLKRDEVLHDGTTIWDDSISIEIESPVYPGGDNYVIQVNSIGTTFECIWGGEKGSMPGITLGWDPRVINASTLTAEVLPDRPQGWVIETAIPWGDLEPHIARPGPGDTLHMNFARIWREMMEEYHAWQGYDEFRPKGEVVFVGEEGVVVQMMDTGDLNRGRAVFLADIKNMASSQRDLVVEVSTDSGELHEKKEISLGAGEEKSYEFNGFIGDFATTLISFTVSEKGAAEPLHITTLPVIRPTEPDIYLARMRSLDLLKIWTDLTYIGTADLDSASVNVKVVNLETGGEVFNRTFTGFTSYNPVLEVSTEGWELAEYDIEAVFNAPGMEPHTITMPYEYPPMPVWWENRYGYTDVDNDRVPYPWTNMEVKDDVLEVWGRRYIFNNKLLPEQVTTLGSPVLRGPMRMIINTAGGDEVDTSLLEAESEWTLTNRTRVEGARKVDTGSFEITNSFWAEYDGFVWSRLTVEPKTASDVAYMEIEVPLAKEFTDVIKSMRTVGKLNPDGHKLRIGDIYFSPPWLGNADGGIQCFVTADFNLKDLNTSMVIEVPEDGATLRLKIIDMATQIDSPYTVEFGFIATPVRPNITRTPYFRSRSTAGGGTFYPSGLESLPAPDPGADAYGGGSKTGRIYVWTSCVSIAEDESGTADFRHYGTEWMKDPFQRPRQGWNTQVINPYGSSAFIDYFVWRHWRFQNKYGFGGLYYDNPSLGTFENRELIKRLYNVTLDNTFIAGRDAAMGLASNGIYNMAFSAFFSYQWNGEHLNSEINANQQTYLGLIDPAVFRAEYMGHNWGWPTMFLGQGRIRRDWVDANGGPEAVFDQLYGLGLIHDSYSFCCILPGVTRQLQDRRGQDVNKLNLSHWKYQFTPYWKQDIVELPGEDMYASFYIARPSLLAATNPLDHMGYPYGHRASTFRHYFKGHEEFPTYIHSGMYREIENNRNLLGMMEDRAVMVVYNDSGWEGEMRLKVDWDKIGLGSPAGLSVDNYLHRTGFRVEETVDEEGNTVEKPVFFERNGEYARIEGDEIVFPMTGYNYRMIVIEQAKP